LILCAGKGAALARYALEGLPNKVMASDYLTALPDVGLIEQELERTRKALETQWLLRSQREAAKKDKTKSAKKHAK
jgi:hypothetical protein